MFISISQNETEDTDFSEFSDDLVYKSLIRLQGFLWKSKVFYLYLEFGSKYNRWHHSHTIMHSRIWFEFSNCLSHVKGWGTRLILGVTLGIGSHFDSRSASRFLLSFFILQCLSVREFCVVSNILHTQLCLDNPSHLSKRRLEKVAMA